MNLLVHYSNGTQLLTGLPTQVAQYKVKDANPKREKYSMILRVSNNIHQIPQLENVEFIEEWVEEEKIPVKKDVPAPAKTKSEEKPAEGDKPAEDQKQPEPQPPVEEVKQEYEIRKKNKKTSTYL